MIKQRFKRQIVLLVFIILISSLGGVINAASPDDQLININFKGVDLRDVFRTIAELAGVNLVTDSSVEGSLTLKLKDITFKEALDLITRTQQLAYKWDGNTVVVATPEKLEAIYARVATRTINIQYADPVAVKGIINGIYPGLNIQIDQRNNNLIVKGKEEEIDEALDLIGKIDLPQDTRTRTVKLKFADPGKAAELVQSFYPDLKVEQDGTGGQLILYGNVENVNAARDLIKEIDVSPVEKSSELVAGTGQTQAAEENQPAGEKSENTGTVQQPGQEKATAAEITAEKEAEPILKTVKLKYADPVSVQAQIKGLFPEVNVQVDMMNKQLILLGSEELLMKVEKLITMVDLKPERVVKTEELTLEYIDPLKFRKQLLVKYPELQVKISGENGLTLSGSAADVNQALKFIVEEDQPEEKKEARQVTESVQIVNTELEAIKEQLNKVLPELKIVIDSLSQELLITGEEKQVRSAVLTARKLDKANQETTRFIQMDYLNLGKAGEIITGLYPGIRLQLNEEKRQLIISGKVAEVEKALITARKLNTPRRQVVIEARVEEIKINKLKNLGLYPDKLSGISFIKNDDGQINGLTVNWPSAIKALEDEGSSNTLANPRLMTLNGEQAKLLIGDRIPIVVDTEDGGQQIQYIDAGITLQFTPWVGEDNQITLDVSPKVSNIGESIGSSIPPVNTREAQTKIRLKDGQTFAIGGLIQDNELKSTSEVPLLSEIPIIGELFKKVDNQDTRTELIIFITPHIVKDNGAGDQEVRDKISIGSAPDQDQVANTDPDEIRSEGEQTKAITDNGAVTDEVKIEVKRSDTSREKEEIEGRKLVLEEQKQVIGLTIEELEKILDRELK